MRRFKGIKMGGRTVKQITLPDNLELDFDGNRLALTSRYIWKLPRSQCYSYPMAVGQCSLSWLNNLATRQARGDFFCYPMEVYRELGATAERFYIDVITANGTYSAKLCVYSDVGELMWVSDTFGSQAGLKALSPDPPLEFSGEFFWVGILNQADITDTGPTLRSVRPHALIPRLGYEAITQGNGLPIIAGVWAFYQWPDPPTTLNFSNVLIYYPNSTGTIPLVWVMPKVLAVTKNRYEPSE